MAKGEIKNDEQVARFISERMPEAEYAGNYTGCDGCADLRCKKCGTVFNRSMISIRKRHCSCPTCAESEKAAAREKKEKAKQAAQAERERKEQKRKANKAAKSKQIRLAKCGYCGALFYTWSDARVYCSDQCSRRSFMRTRGSDDRLNRTNIVDRDITLERLFERDKGTCQICGGKCDYSDYRYNENGVFVAGDLYPSKDHIVPLSMGGKHSWDNVRLAHRICNSKLYQSGKQTA